MKWSEEITALGHARYNDKPKGWSTIDEVAKEISRSRSETYKVLLQLVRAGRCERVRWGRLNEDGRGVTSFVYKLKTKK
jgi:predicted transcriptional regulator